MSVAASPPVQPRRSARFILVLRDVMARPSGAIGLTLVAAHLVLALISPLADGSLHRWEGMGAV